MAVLNTLRTNKYLKVLTFSAIFFMLLIFVADPSSLLGAGNSNTDTVVGSVYGSNIEQNQIDLNGRTVNPWNFGTRMELFNFYKSNPQQPFFSFGTVLDLRNTIIADLVWDNFITRSFVDYEMNNMGFYFSDVEQIDLYKGTVTGTDNIHPLFRSWWTPLGLCNQQANPLCIDTISGIELEQEIKLWKTEKEKTIEEITDKINKKITLSELEKIEFSNSQNLLSLDETYKKIYIEEESKIQKYFSIYQNGYFIPDNIIASENINDNKNASGMYIYIPFRDINNISPTDAEILDYYNNNKYKFPNSQKTRELDYYMFISKNNDNQSADSIYDVAREFNRSASTVEEFKELAKSYNVQSGSLTLNSIMENKIISQINNNPSSVRDVVRWAYGVNVEDEIIENINTGDTYHLMQHDIQIIFCLKSINEDDYQSLDDVRAEIIKELTNQARGLEVERLVNVKSATKQKLSTCFNDGITCMTDLFQLLKKDGKEEGSGFPNIQLENIQSLKFTADKFQNRNLDDPELIGTFFGMPMDVVSNPYVGKDGVYILLKNEEKIDDSVRSISIEDTRRRFLAKSFYSNVLAFRDQIISFSKENESITDRRSFIY